MPSEFPKIQVIYSKDEPFINPIIIWLEANGLRLQFDGQKQSLRLIEVVDWGKTKISYKDSEIGKQGFVTFRAIYSKVFGPTYPGFFDEVSRTYTLSYPGVAFTFIMPDEVQIPSSSEDMIKYLMSNSSPNCKSMAIFEGDSYAEATNDIFKPTWSIASRKDADEGLKIDIVYASTTPSSGVCQLIFASHARGLLDYDIEVGITSMQDVIMTLGPPSERFFKQDSRLSIHSPNDGEGNYTDLFFNYYSLGIDLSFDSLVPNCPVKKVIIHGNVPGSLLFQRYKRCRWKIDNTTTSEHKFTEYADKFSRNKKPMVLNRVLESPSSSMELIGEPEIIEPAMEDWGLTDLYGSSGCIFEVLKNGAVSSLTIY